MSSSSSSPSIPFRSKKRLLDSPCPKAERKNSNSTSMDLPTPEKPPENMLTRSRNRGIALSVKEIRQAADSRRRSEYPKVETRSAKNKLVFPSSDSSTSSPCERKIGTLSGGKEKLPEKYETLAEFFDGLDNAIRLSKLKNSMPTFSNISAKIEYLTERRFLYCHLAQMKHILPEAIEIKRVLTLDEKTSCMKPDLHVTLNPDAIFADKSNSESKNINLRKVFRARLADFVKAHPQDEEVPEELLPEPFNRKKQNEGSTDEAVSSSLVDEHSASHPFLSFQENNSNEKTVSAGLSSTKRSTVKSSSSCPTGTLLQVSSPNDEMASTPAKPSSSQSRVASTPVKPVATPAKVDSASVVVTPAKVASTPVKAACTPPELASTPARLIGASLVAQPQKGSAHARVDDSSASPPNKLMRRPSALRPLNFDGFTEDKKAMEVADDEIANEASEEGTSIDDDILQILPDTLLQSIREQEKKAIEDQDPAISQAKRRRKMIACLPRLFNVTHFLFQSIRRSVITKEELVHKIIAGHSDICDRREVEEQLNLMLELVPDWITEKRSFSGDLLVCIKKMASPESIRARLEEESRQGMAPVS
ncbi:PREDICTED: CDT1-like protein a, chloroplastic [Tarenaya hassleriana]|uniref:CDT1-like protein a, chloroplastic n=1 Tax=Tarenaya hassleriana TaxID=28532 RepID=UPI00053C650A|nr:PREDICTED: CDT1-like protein a, chloroplastic [Tarenaya hassleriana]